MDSATKAAWVAAAIAAVAAVFAISSAWSSHRSARSAADTLALERDRRHDELTPHIQVRESYADKQKGLAFINDGPLDYTKVRIRGETPDEVSPIGALQIGEAWIPVSPNAPDEGNLGPMTAGQRRLIPYRRNVPARGSILQLRITCENDRGTWTIRREVDIPPPIPDTIG